MELGQSHVGPVFLELTNHALAGPRNTQNILITCRIQIDRYKNILFQSRQLLVVNILADLLVKLRQRFIGPILQKFTEHALAGTRNHQDLFVRRCVEVDLDEHFSVDFRQLLSAEGLGEERV